MENRLQHNRGIGRLDNNSSNSQQLMHFCTLQGHIFCRERLSICWLTVQLIFERPFHLGHLQPQQQYTRPDRLRRSGLILSCIFSLDEQLNTKKFIPLVPHDHQAIDDKIYVVQESPTNYYHKHNSWVIYQYSASVYFTKLKASIVRWVLRHLVHIMVFILKVTNSEQPHNCFRYWNLQLYL